MARVIRVLAEGLPPELQHLHGRHRICWLEAELLRSYGQPSFTDYLVQMADFESEWRSALRPAWAYGVGLSGKQPSSVTIGARLACLSSFYRFLIRMKVVSSNPCDAIVRPRVIPGPPRGLSADDIRRLLAAIPETPVGHRYRAIILALTLTGRRRQEVLDLKAGSISFDGATVFYTYRGKGGKTGRRELPRPALGAIQTWLASQGKDLATMKPEESLWPDTRNGRGITSGTFYTNLRRYLKKAGLPPPASTSSGTLPLSSAATSGVHRGRQPLPGPQQPGNDDDVPAQAGGPGGPELGEGGRGDRGLS